MKITLKNGDLLELKANSTALIAAQAISEGLARAAVAAKVNGKLQDLTAPLHEGDTLEIITLKGWKYTAILARTFLRRR